MSGDLGTEPVKWSRACLVALDGRGDTPREEILDNWFTQAMEAAHKAGMIEGKVKEEP